MDTTHAIRSKHSQAMSKETELDSLKGVATFPTRKKKTVEKKKSAKTGSGVPKGQLKCCEIHGWRWNFQQSE